MSSDPSVHFCGELFLPAELAEQAVENALRENPDNASFSPDVSVPSAGGIIEPGFQSGPTEPALTEQPAEGNEIRPGDVIEPPVAIGLFVRKMWANGRTLRCLFLGGTPFIQSKVKQYAAVWTQYANIKFAFVNSGPAEIRISFKWGAGSWSYIGTDALSIAQDQATMNYGWFTDSTPDEEFSRTVTHEFGHAIGCVHEHSQPNANIQWNKPVVYEAYKRSQGWTPQQVDFQVFARYSSADVTASAFDAFSIMEYPIPKEFTTNGFSAPNNTHLSQTDIAFIARMYPYPPKVESESSAIDTGVFNTMSIRPWNAPALDNRATIKFATPAIFPPTVVVGLNWLDFGNTGNIRIKSIVENVTNESFSLNMKSWADTVNYSSGVSWLQIPSNDTDFQTGKFNTMDDHDWTKPQPQTSRKITFRRRFSAPPKVVVFIDSMDVEHTANCRVKVYASDIAADSFVIHIDSWADTKLWSTGAVWVAYEPNKKGVASGRYSTNDIRQWNQPRHANSSQISFNGGNFTKPPRVFMALSSLDIDKNANARVRLSASSVTPTGMEWHIDSWGDTTLYEAGASYIAIQ